MSLSVGHAIGEASSVDLIALHALEAIDARKSRIVELKFFGGLTIAEIAEVMELSPAPPRQAPSGQQALQHHGEA